MSFLDAPSPIAFSHRGYAPDGCENSMAAFERAVALGYRYLETDVRATADGIAVAFHDATLDRVSDGRGRISELTWTQLSAARIRGREPIPQLVDVLNAWPKVRINIDIKTDASIGPTIEAITAAGAVDRVCVGAFSGARVATLRRTFGDRLCTSLGPREAFALRLAAVRRARFAGRAGSRSTGGSGARCAQLPARIGPRAFVDRRIVDEAHRLGMPVHVWTVNTRSEMQRLLNIGVDGIMTDQAEVLREVLIERGAWHQ